MGYIEVKTSETVCYFKCITFYKTDRTIRIQFFNGRQNEFISFERKKNSNLGLAELYVNCNNENEYLKSIKKDNGDILYLTYL